MADLLDGEQLSLLIPRACTHDWGRTGPEAVRCHRCGTSLAGAAAWIVITRGGVRGGVR